MLNYRVQCVTPYYTIALWKTMSFGHNDGSNQVKWTEFMKTALLSAALILATTTVSANEFTYAEIAKRNSQQALTKAQLDQMKIQAECLVGIKKLNFKRKDSFDPIAEWSSFRTRALLEKYSPCETLVMLEIAQKQLKTDG